jgi:concanavalin A-like lectin/glucanase superfamily protein
MKKTVFLTVLLTMAFSVGTAWSQLPTGWNEALIGTTGGGATSTGYQGVWTVSGDGHDIWDNDDDFVFAYTTLSGDGFIQARNTPPAFTGTNTTYENCEWAKAGVMIRESTDRNSKHACMAITRNLNTTGGNAGHFYSFQRREVTGEGSGNTDGDLNSNVYPVWTRIVRSGGTLEGFVSWDGTDWTSVGSITDTLPTTVLIGLAVTSHSTGILTTQTFDSMDYTGMPKEAPQVIAGADQKISWPTNSVVLSGTVADNGQPLPDNPGSPSPTDPNKLRWTWSVIGSPAGSSPYLTGGDGDAFTYDNPLNPIPTSTTLTVDMPGLYTVKLNATDSTNSGYNDSNDLVVVSVYPDDGGLILHYSFDGMSTGDPVIEDIAPGAFIFDPVTLLPVRYDHPGRIMTGNVAWDPNIVQGPENDGNPPDVILLAPDDDFHEAIQFDVAREQWVACENTDGIHIPDPNFPIRGGDPRTYMCWAKVDLNNDAGLWDQGHYADGNNFSLRTVTDSAGNNWRVQYWGAPDFDFYYDSMGKWTHFALVYDGDASPPRSDMLVDGLLFSGKEGAISTSDIQALMLGRWSFDYLPDGTVDQQDVTRIRYLDGVMDDFRIYRRALTAQEVVEAAGIGNTAPTASAGPDLRLVGGTSIVIPGNDNDDTDPTKAWWLDTPGNVDISWVQVSGPGTAGITNGTTISPTINFAGQPYGLYVLELTVSDGIAPLPDAVDTMAIMYQATTGYGELGMWQLDDGGGITAADSSGNGYHGTLASTDLVDPNLPTWVAGKVGTGAVDFINSGDDIGQSVNLDNVPVAGDLTVAFWMNSDSVRNCVPIDKLPNGGTAGWNIKVRDNSEIWLQVGSEANHTFVSATGNQYAAGEWVYVTATFDSATSTGAIYVNGLLQASVSGITQTADSIATPLRLAQPSEAQLGERFQGQLDHVSVYDEALSQLEVALLAVSAEVEMEDCILNIPGVPIVGDLNNDCYVDLLDFGIQAGNWLECTDLNNPTCWP